MRVGVMLADGRLAAEQCHPALHPSRRRTEVFFSRELAAFTDPLVDAQVAGEALREREAQDPKSNTDPSGPDGAWEKGSE